MKMWTELAEVLPRTVTFSDSIVLSQNLSSDRLGEVNGILRGERALRIGRRLF